MAYFSTKQVGIEGGAKVVADIFCAALLLTFSLVFFGMLIGLVGFIIVECAILSIDYIVPNDDEVSGAVIR